MIGTNSKPPIEAQSAIPVPTADGANGPESERASIERLGLGKVADSATTTKIAQRISTVRAEWLIDNLAKAGKDPRLRKQTSSWFEATALPDNIDRGSREVARSISKQTLDFGDTTNSELRSSPISRTRTDGHHTARRGTLKSARRKGGNGLYWVRFYQRWEF